MTQPTGDSLSDQINMVGEGTIFEGTLRAKSNVRVSGRIKGTLQVEGRAIITQEGAVEGEVRSTDADIAGSVQGEIHVEERLMLKSSARVDGSIEAGRIKVEEGALFTGQCSIGENVEQEVRDQIEKQGWQEQEKSAKGASGGGTSSGTSGRSASEDASPSRSGGLSRSNGGSSSAGSLKRETNRSSDSTGKTVSAEEKTKADK